MEQIPSAASILRDLPEKADQKHVVYTKIQKKSMNHNIPQGFFNQTVWKPQQSPRAPLISLPRSQWDNNQLAISTGPEPMWVDLVVNNLDEGPHPFHLVRIILPRHPRKLTAPARTPLLYSHSSRSPVRLGLLQSFRRYFPPWPGA